MSSIFSQGVALADYDPTAVGGMMFLTIEHEDLVNEYASQIAPGDVIDGAYLYPAGIFHDRTDDSAGVVRSNTMGGTQWKSCGHLAPFPPATTTNDRYATLFVRIE